ncbi:Thiol-disulfide oxidoreductase ResA [compost metagenome]
MILNKVKLSGIAIIATAILLSVGISEGHAQRPQTEIVTDQVQLAKLIAAVETHPDSLSAHQAYIKAVGINSPSVVAQYENWIKKYPKSAMVPYALGKAYEDQESPKAKPYLLKTVAIDPKFAEAWSGLWIDAQRWGDFKGGSGYLKKATEADPGNAAYAFYYSDTFRDTDPKRYLELTLDVAKRFPASDRGAQALYWLAVRSSDVKDKLKYFELLHNSFDPAKFNWSSSGMSSYFNILLTENPKRAVELAQEMAKDKKTEKEWGNLVVQAQRVADAKDLMDKRKSSDALALLNQVKLPRYYSFNKELLLLKAETDDMGGKTNAAYDSLIVSFAKQPGVKLKFAIVGYGAKLGKNAAQVDADILKRLNLVAKVATPFKLKNYLTPGYTSLADYKGKVVLLTYWFPGCGPCRGEFPHFENVIRKFKGLAVDYVGINIASDQNDYVLPFMKGSGYSFTPLEDVKGRDKGNLDNGNAAPTNFLIDKEGRIIFSNFRIDGDNEDQLELMINMLLQKEA